MSYLVELLIVAGAQELISRRGHWVIHNRDCVRCVANAVVIQWIIG